MPGLLQVIQQGQFRGAEVFALDLSTELARQGTWSVSLASLFHVDPGYATAVAGAGLTLTTARSGSAYRAFDARVVWRLRSLIDQGRFSVVQANGASTLKYLVAARQLSRRPWSLVYRAIGVGSFWRRGRVRHLAYRWLLARPHRVVAVCRAVADDLTTKAGVNPAKVVILSNGVALPRVQPSPGDRERTRRALGVGSSEFLLCYVGSLAPEKNLSAFVDVVARCRLQGLVVKAFLVGDGPRRDGLLLEAQRAGLDGGIHILPSRPGIGSLLAGADLFVLPSVSEGMPAAVIEAGLCGVPTVAYGVGGLPEVISHEITGVLVGVNDLDGMASAVCSLLRDSDRRATMGEAARRQYQRFNIRDVASQYSEMYGSLLDGQRQ